MTKLSRAQVVGCSLAFVTGLGISTNILQATAEPEPAVIKVAEVEPVVIELDTSKIEADFDFPAIELEVEYEEPAVKDSTIIVDREQFHKQTVTKKKTMSESGVVEESSDQSVLPCLSPMIPENDYLMHEWVGVVRHMILQEFPEVNAVYGSRPGDPQDHGKGLALDVMVPVGSDLGDEVNEWLVYNFDALNISYLIWEQQILMSANGSWKMMEDRGGVTANHFDHVHISFKNGSGSCSN